MQLQTFHSRSDFFISTASACRYCKGILPHCTECSEMISKQELLEMKTFWLQGELYSRIDTKKAIYKLYDLIDCHLALK